MPYVQSLQWMLPDPREVYTERENEAPIKGVEEVNNIILSLEWSFYGTGWNTDKEISLPMSLSFFALNPTYLLASHSSTYCPPPMATSMA